MFGSSGATADTRDRRADFQKAGKQVSSLLA